MHRYLSTGSSTIATLMACRAGPAAACDTTPFTTLLPDLARAKGHVRRTPRDAAVRPGPAARPPAATSP